MTDDSRTENLTNNHVVAVINGTESARNTADALRGAGFGDATLLVGEEGANQIDALRGHPARATRGVPLIGRSLRVRVDDRHRIAMPGKLTGQDDRDGRLAASALGIGDGKDAGHRYPPESMARSE